MRTLLQQFNSDEQGQDMIEYAMIGLLIALGCLAAMGNLASSITGEFNKIAGQLT